MKLWLLHTDDYDYDEHDEMVVRAETEQKARQLAFDTLFTHERRDRWLVMGAEGSSAVTCEEVTVEGESEVITVSFNAG